MTELRFGTFLAPNVMPVYQAIVDEVGSRLDMTTELVVETDYENCRNDINDICFVCGLPYVMFEREGTSPATPITAPVLKGERYKGKPVYFSDVIVHRDSGIRTSPISVDGRGYTTSRCLTRDTGSPVTTWSPWARPTVSLVR